MRSDVKKAYLFPNATLNADKVCCMAFDEREIACIKIPVNWAFYTVLIMQMSLCLIVVFHVI